MHESVAEMIDAVVVDGEEIPRLILRIHVAALWMEQFSVRIFANVFSALVFFLVNLPAHEGSTGGLLLR